MDHEEINQKLPAYAEGELPEGERVAIDAHLAKCGICRRELALWRDSLRVFFTPRRVSAESTGALVRQVMARLPTRTSNHPWLAMPNLRWFVPVMGFSLAALALSFIPQESERADAIEPVLGDPNAKAISNWINETNVSRDDILFELFREGK